MTSHLCRKVAALAIIVGCSFWSFPPALCATDVLPEESAALANVGEAGPNPIALNIRTDKPQNYEFRPGESLVLNVKTSREAYVSAIYLSGAGDAVVLLPNSENPDALVPADKELNLFGSESCVKLKITDKTKEGQIVFYVASKPLRLDPLKPAEGQPCVQISRSDKNDLKLLGEKLQGLAKDEGFNRVVMRLKTTSGAGLSLNLMGLPTAIKTEKPENITGVQGARPENKKP